MMIHVYARKRQYIGYPFIVEARPYNTVYRRHQYAPPVYRRHRYVLARACHCVPYHQQAPERLPFQGSLGGQRMLKIDSLTPRSRSIQ
eukprot:scaffold537505_cov27-Prasinocladus_malaysianus.AAC.2